ncbi:hypothetical protein SAMN04488012_102233 [Palleronia salina]|uniref:Aminoglycoside phosphotransferase domain-containing protein n=1 Tax=Palleronia salina TaxID=313368 RepID=A0A1M6D292_9RHOB|nr:phosphotransferase [Palleronia salina]SHI67233.1 hypothetical protein SAMN04488012_102233 [Palleronia salina]
MTERVPQIDAFLRGAGWDDAVRMDLAGDASARRYLRLSRDDATAILMDAPPDTCGRQNAFLRLGDHLRGLGLGAPAMLAADLDAGLLLLEDLGDRLVSRLVAHDASLERPLYAAATDALVQVQSAPPPADLPRYGPSEMARAIRLTWEHYLGQDDPPSPAWLELESALEQCLSRHDNGTPVLVHRDYHADNLLWRPDERGLARLGVLDFQDAVAGHPAYDLASLLQDARRSTAPGIEDEMIDRFTRARHLDPEDFRAAYAVQAAQRHLRILGIFARLAQDRGKPGYLAHLPRVWADLQRDLDHPALHDVRDRVLSLIPAPAR